MPVFIFKENKSNLYVISLTRREHFVCICRNILFRLFLFVYETLVMYSWLFDNRFQKCFGVEPIHIFYVLRSNRIVYCILCWTDCSKYLWYWLFYDYHDTCTVSKVQQEINHDDVIDFTKLWMWLRDCTDDNNLSYIDILKLNNISIYFIAVDLCT